MTAVAGALGSVIGYLGAEVAEDVVFERLLWPERYYNDLSVSTFFKLALVVPMGGPLHRAALATLDKFRDNKLYLGAGRGNMLGTAFYRDSKVQYYVRTEEGQQSVAKEARNAFWVEVLRCVKAHQSSAETDRLDNVEAKAGTSPTRIKRAAQMVYDLKLEQRHGGEAPSSPDTNRITVEEDSISLRSVIGIVASESISTGLAIFTAIYFRNYWLTTYLVLPLLLKLLSILVSVRREPISPLDPSSSAASSASSSSSSSSSAAPTTSLIEIDDLNLGFALIEAPCPVAQQFFRHYGHPRRGARGSWDRAREMACLTLVYFFVVYFPAGLVGLLWMQDEVQYTWLGYQVYAIVAMHVSRMAGWSGCGRTEGRVARALGGGARVLLRSRGGEPVEAKLRVMRVDSVEEGSRVVKERVRVHCAGG